MRWLILAALFAVPQYRPSRVVIDRKALGDFLATKNLKVDDFHFDFDHLSSMPEGYFAGYSAPEKNLGHLKLYRRIQKDPITFPEEVQTIEERILKGELFEAICEAVDQPFKRAPLPEPVALELPDELKKPVGRIVAAIDAKDAALILDAIVDAKAALLAFKGDVNYAKEGIVVTSSAKPEDPGVRLFLKFGGNDVYKGRWAGGDGGHVRVVIDTGGDDTYDAGEEACAQGAGSNGIGVLVDLAGNDTYTAKNQLAQGAGHKGTGILWDAAGNDTYTGESISQGAGVDGIGILIDDAGNDAYELTYGGQGYGNVAAFGLLLDRDGDDRYLGRDSAFGHKVTVPAPQDEKHNANMVQGAGTGNNSKPASNFRAGGVGMLLDVHGDDVYRSGCWSQGVGYFLGIGAIIDLEGDDRYESWVYIMGSGAHGGQGIQLDARGSDTYKVGGWNSLAMSVDYGIGMFLDGAGNDRYVGGASGHGMSIGLGISLFQDGGGDDVYEPKDANMGSGRFYEQEDYNVDGKVTPAEKRHWGIFLDLGGSDRYPAAFGNAKRWDVAEFSGGFDVSSPKPDFLPGKARGWDGKEVDVTEKNWESVRPDDLFKLLKGDETLRAIFALSHGLVKEGSELLSKAADPKPVLERFFGPGDYSYEPALRLWFPQKDAAWVAKLKELKWGATPDIAAYKPESSWPKWAQREAAGLAQAELARRGAAAIERIQKFLEKKDAKTLIEKKKELDALREKALACVGADDAKATDDAVKRLAAAWAGRRSPSLKNEVLDAAKELDLIDKEWRTRFPIAFDTDVLTLEAIASLKGPDLSKLPPPAKSLIQAVNDYRAMFGRAPLEPNEALAKHATKAAGASPGATADGFAGEIAALAGKGRSANELLETWRRTPADNRQMLDVKWKSVGVGATSGGAWCMTVAKPK